MEIILIQDVDTLGQKDDVVTVKNGYARNLKDLFSFTLNTFDRSFSMLYNFFQQL